MTTLRQRREWYEAERARYATTVEEFEVRHGFPPFTLYPTARRARGPRAAGFFMYSPGRRAEALAEEDREICCLLALAIERETIALIYHRPPKTFPEIGM